MPGCWNFGPVSGQQLNFEAMKKIVTAENAIPIEISEPFKILRKHPFDVTTLPMTNKENKLKKYDFCFSALNYFQNNSFENLFLFFE